MQSWCSKFVFICLMMINHLTAQGSEKVPEGWNWYQESVEELTTEETTLVEKKTSSPSQPALSSSPWDQKLKTLQKQHDEALAKAIMNPSAESVESVLKLHKEIMDKALVFQKMWGQVLIQKGQTFMDPETNPNGLYQKITQEKRTQDLRLKLKKISKHYGLFLALKKGCPYCEAFAPIVQEFARVHGFEVLGIGDVSSSAYPFKVLQDNGVLQLINPEHKYPALFLVNLKQKEVWPLAWGLNSLSDLHLNAQIVVQQIMKGKAL